MVSPIPIRNVYYLLAYAWDFWRSGIEVDADAETCPDVENLLAHILNEGIRRIFRRGIEKHYVVVEEETARLRGRILLAESARRFSLWHGRAFCRFDELSSNVVPNRILRTTVSRLLRLPGITLKNRESLRRCEELLWNVSPIQPTQRLFRRIQYHRNNRGYRLLIHVCELIHYCLLPEEQSGRRRFRNILRDETRMPQLFESFVFNFAKRHCGGAQVIRKRIPWDAVCADEAARDVLPGMETDVTISRRDRKIILDCKFYKDALTSGYRSDPKLHSANLYQIFAYLVNQSIEPGWESVEGILLYPAVDNAFDHRYRIHHHPLRICSLNLDQPWQKIHLALLDVLGE